MLQWLLVTNEHYEVVPFGVLPCQSNRGMEYEKNSKSTAPLVHRMRDTRKTKVCHNYKNMVRSSSVYPYWFYSLPTTYLLSAIPCHHRSWKPDVDCSMLLFRDMIPAAEWAGQIRLTVTISSLGAWVKCSAQSRQVRHFYLEVILQINALSLALVHLN